MIEGFLTSLDLFATTYAVGLLIAVVLASVGVWVVARDHIFLGAAVAQASTLGVALALWLAGSAAAGRLAWLESDLLAAGLAVVASVATAWLAARGGESGRESEEAIIGWVFLLAASLPVLLLAHSPHGLEEVQRLLFSTLLSVSRADVWLFGALAVATAAAIALLRSRLLLFTMDPAMAAALGMRSRVWGGATAVWLGLAVGLSIRASGMLYTFGLLVLPALIAKNVCREVRPMLAVAPVCGFVAAGVGFVIAHQLDLPPAHVSVFLLCLALAAAWLLRALAARRGAAAPSGPDAAPGPP